MSSLDVSKSQPFLICPIIGRVLESILVSVAVALEEEMKYTREIVNDILTDLEVDINRENLRRLLHYSRRIAGFQSRAKYVLASIEEVLESGTYSIQLDQGGLTELQALPQMRICRRCTCRRRRRSSQGV